eukprot:Pgem_evm1s16780
MSLCTDCENICQATEKNHVDCVLRMLTDGVDVNSIEDKLNRTPLHLAAINGNKEMVEVLINANAKLNAEEENMAIPERISCILRDQ